ncbi:hypothetical protein [Curtobacterium sp. VKM Ac-2922]|uniref:hypothetical protein n=1 Tax=Curtobacterium sp. VKM Ac-2922 TaxID=2929475 RepID=UPI001FB1EC58|nr:hypothetical protein [Curtobacterium sp. VKM Ac-2922]MCJ1715168.1 hypothetical protein [Curtobacterium sp. VKM Ac-2922]
MTTPQPVPRFGSTRGEFAMLVVLTVVGSFLLPGGGVLVAFLALLTGVREHPRRRRTLFIVALGILVLQAAFVAVAILGPTEACTSFDGGPTTCTT